jgi:putative Holliday junction resolvase
MGRILGLDPGTVRIGAAVSDPLGITAQPHSSLDARDPKVMDLIAALVEDLEVELVVVGLPVSLDGSEGPAAVSARDFAARISEAVDVPVELHDERFSSVTAEQAMIEMGARREDRKAARDRVAAAVFLQTYLDGRR